MDSSAAQNVLKRGRKSYSLTRSKFLTDSEQAQLVSVLERSLKNPANYRDALILFVLLHTGGRAREILNLKVRDTRSQVDFKYYDLTWTLFIR